MAGIYLVMGDLTDIELLRAYLDQKSEEAFGMLVSRHINLVYSSALRRVRDPHLAQEVTQTVFIILAKKASSLGAGTVLTCWLYRTANFAATAALRAEGRRQQREQQLMDLDPTAEPEWADIAPHVEGAVSLLGEKDRCAVLMHYFEHKGFREVGQALGVSEDAAQKRVSRALVKLRGLLVRSAPVASLATLAHLLSANAIQAAPVNLAPLIVTASVSSAASIAGASGSLTLNTLKLMAWTKTKSALAAGVLALLALSLSTVGVYQFAFRGAPDGRLEGAWEGTIQMNGASIRVVARITNGVNGAYEALLDSPDQGAANIPITSVSAKGKTGRFEIKPLAASFEGQLNGSQTEWAGTWSQLGKTSPLTFKRTETPSQVVTAPPQEFSPRPGSDVQGHWRGTLSVGAARLRLVFRVSETAPGQYLGFLDSLDQGARNLPVTVAYTKPKITIEAKAIAGKYEGELDDKTWEVDGQWSQAGRDMDLLLTRGGPETDAAPAGSTLATSDADLQGRWSGDLMIKTTRLRLAITIAKLPGSRYSASLDSLDQGVKDIPASRVLYDAPEARVEWGGIGASFKARLEGGVLKGEWQQGPLKLPLELHREIPKS